MYLASKSSHLLLHNTSNLNLEKANSCTEIELLWDSFWSDDGDSKYISQIYSNSLSEILCKVDNDIGRLQHIPLKHSTAESFHQNGHEIVAIGTTHGELIIWESNINNSTHQNFPPPSEPSPVKCTTYSASNRFLTRNHNQYTIDDLMTAVPFVSLKSLYSMNKSGIEFHHDLDCVFGWTMEEGHAIIRNMNPNSYKLDNTYLSVTDFTYSLENNDIIVCRGYDKNINIYDLKYQNVVSSSSTLTPYRFNSNVVSVDNLIGLGSENGEVLLYDFRSLKNPHKYLRNHIHVLRNVPFQQNKKTKSLFIASGNMTGIKDYLCVDCPPIYTSSSRDKETDYFFVPMALKKTEEIEDSGNKYQFENEESNNCDMNCLGKTSEAGVNNMPACSNLIDGENDDISNYINVMNERLRNLDVDSENIENYILEEIKNFIQFNISDVMDDNRNYFLDTMMDILKQKLFLGTQLDIMAQQLQILVNNQMTMIEVNQRLALEIEKLENIAKIN